MDASTVDWAWPVSWEFAVASARAAGQDPEVVLHDHRLAAHRVLDRLAAAAAEMHDGTPGAREPMTAQISSVMQTLPWLTPADTEGGQHVHESDCVGCKPAPAAVDPVPGPPATMLNDDAISGLAALARELCGDSAANAVYRLTAAARAAERHLPPIVTHTGLTADLAPLAAVPSDEIASGPVPSATEAFDGAFWSHVTTTTALGAVSPCQDTLLRLSEEDLLDHPAPSGTPTNTTGIQRVDVPDPCGPAPRMTIHGSGFGATQPFNLSVIVATWDTSTANSQLNYCNAQTVSWADETVIVQLPSTVVSGYAAFADLQFVKDYNAWVKGRNSRLNVAMRANGCPGQWTVEVPLALNPPSDAAAAYRAGAPVLMAQLSASTGPTRMFDSQTLYLHPGDAFRIGWQVYGADTLTLKPLTADDVATQILTTAGYPATGATLTPADNFLTLTAACGRAAAYLTLEADNGCGTVVAELPIVVAGPALAPATMTVIQSLPAGADVTVTSEGGTETLNPATGNAIPLVAGKRTVVRIDWWAATEQLPPLSTFTAQASVHVTGDLLPFGGVDVPVCVSTADTSPPADPITMSSGPGFDSLVDYQRWWARAGVQGAFFAVLPAEICLGGTIFSTTRPALTVVSATITVTTPSASLSWTLNAGVEVTFHQRRPVTLRYVPFGSTDPSQAPSDEACEATLNVAGSMLPVPDPQIYRLPGPALNAADGHLVEDLEAQRTAQKGAFSDATWRDEIWLVMGGSAGVNSMEYCIATSIDEMTCAHELGHSYFQNHLNVCGNVPRSDSMSTWPDNGYVPVEGWNLWDNADVPTTPPRLDMMAYSYCPGPGWVHPERWRRIFLQAGPPP